MVTNSPALPPKNTRGLTRTRVTGETVPKVTGETEKSLTQVTPKRVTRRSYKPRARRCKHCEKSFTPKTKHGRFCSDTCRKLGWSKTHKKALKPKETVLHVITCPGCGKSFFGEKDQKYCKPSCKTAAWRIRRQAAVEAIAIDMQLSHDKAADVVEVSGMKKITEYLSGRGYCYDDIARMWMRSLTIAQAV